MKTRLRNSRQGITALHIIAIIVFGVMFLMCMGLLLPAMNQAREAGRRTVCINNIRNVALAIIAWYSRSTLPSTCNCYG